MQLLLLFTRTLTKRNSLVFPTYVKVTMVTTRKVQTKGTKKTSINNVNKYLK